MCVHACVCVRMWILKFSMISKILKSVICMLVLRKYIGLFYWYYTLITKFDHLFAHLRGWIHFSYNVSSVHFSRSVVSDSLWPNGLQHARLPCLSPTPHRVNDAIQQSLSLSSPSPSAFNLSQHQGFSQWVSSLDKVAKVLGFRFNISPSNEYSGLISFRMDWLDLLAAQGTLKSLLQYHSSKASIPRPSAFFMIQHSHPHMTTGKTIAWTRWTFAAKVNVSTF